MVLRCPSCADSCSGVAILTVPTFIFVLIVCAGWAVFTFKEGAIRSSAIILVAALSVVAIWSVRNYIIFGEPVFVSTNSGVNLLLGNSKNTLANSGVNVDLQDYRPPSGLNEVEVDKYYRNEAIKFILSDPYRWLKLYTKKVANYFNYEVAQVSQVRTVSFQNLDNGRDVWIPLDNGCCARPFYTALSHELAWRRFWLLFISATLCFRHYSLHGFGLDCRSIRF